MIAMLIVAIWLAVVGVVLAIFAGGAETTCTNNCNQGRNCTCAGAKSNHA
jgi:hypothetical protein